MAFATDIQSNASNTRPLSFLKALFSRRHPSASTDRKERAEEREREFRKHFAKTRSNARVWL